MPGRQQWWKNALRQQIWPHRGNCDGPRLCHPILWKVIARRRTLLRHGNRCHIYTIRGHWLGWQAGPTQHQCIGPVGRPVIDHPSHHQMMCWSWGTWYIPIHICLHYHHLGFIAGMGPNRKRGSRVPMSTWRSPSILIRCHTMTKTRHYNVATTMAKDGKTCGWHWFHTFTGVWVSEWQKFNVKSSLVSSWSNRSGSSRHSHCGWCCRESGGHRKINLPVFQDEDMKDAVTFQSWHWDLTVYHHTGWQDCTLLPYIIHSLQGYPGELVRSSGTVITLDGILTMLDEHYNNVKALDALNQALFQLQMGEEMVSEWGCICQGTSKFSQFCSQNAFHWITLPNWSVTASMVGFLSSLKWWWYTSRKAVMRRHIPIISEWCRRLRKRKQWNHPTTHPQPVPASTRWQASFLCRNSKAVSQPWPPLHGWHTWRKRVLTRRNMSMVKTHMASKA